MKKTILTITLLLSLVLYSTSLGEYNFTELKGKAEKYSTIYKNKILQDDNKNQYSTIINTIDNKISKISDNKKLVTLIKKIGILEKNFKNPTIIDLLNYIKFKALEAILNNIITNNLLDNTSNSSSTNNSTQNLNTNYIDSGDNYNQDSLNSNSSSDFSQDSSSSDYGSDSSSDFTQDSSSSDYGSDSSSDFSQDSSSSDYDSDSSSDFSQDSSSSDYGSDSSSDFSQDSSSSDYGSDNYNNDYSPNSDFSNNSGNDNSDISNLDNSNNYDNIIENRQKKIYMPAKIIWDENKKIVVSNTQELQQAVQNATKNTTIILKDGNYTPRLNLSGKSYLTIKAENKYGAKWSCPGQRGCLFYDNIGKVGNINIIGLDISGGGYFIFFQGTGKNTDAYNFYIADCHIHDTSVAIYSGLHSHDWTLDRILFHDSNSSYLWYMMGWHNTVQNSILYNNPYFYIAIRGHYPLGEAYSEGGNPSSKNRPLSQNKEWTHTIINNTFGSTYKNGQGASHSSKAQLILYYAPGDSKTEDSYLPPKDVLIANNVFVDNGPAKLYGIVFDASEGINNGKPQGVNGIKVINNVTSKSKLFEEISDSNKYGNNTVNAKNIKFKDEKGRDYHLTAESTDLIDKGINSPLYPKYDFENKPRQGNPDVGALEYTGNSK